MKTEPASFFITGGTLRHDAPSYVERQADRDLLEGLADGEFCYVLTSRQMGKSSLMVRTAIKLREAGAHVVALDLTAIGQNLTPEQWYDGLAMRMGRQLDLEEELEEFWNGHSRLGPCQRWITAVRDCILARRPGRLVIFIDEIDTVRSLRFSTDEFFAAIRECYNRRVEDAEFRRITFCLLGVATPSDLIRDTRTTPFNIGRRIELHDFTAEEAMPLALGLVGRRGGRAAGNVSRTEANAATANAELLLQGILFWTGGHPYLTQRFCQAIADDVLPADEEAVDRICEELFLSHRAHERDDNLLFVRERLLRSEVDVVGLLELYGRVVQRGAVADDETSPLVSVLRLSGIVAVEGRFLRVRNRIYSKVFDPGWIRAHMPDAERRRQRAAFWRGVIRTTAIAAVVVAVLGIVVTIAVGQARRARENLALSNFSQAQTWRVSGMAGQRYESLEALQRARPSYTNDAAIRDEAIACLALVDLKLDFVRTNFPLGATALAIDPNLDDYAMGEESGAISVMRIPEGRITTRLPPTGLPVAWLALSPDGRFLAAQYEGGGRHRFLLWSLTDLRAVVESTNRVHAGAIDFNPDGTLLAGVIEPGMLDVFSLPAAGVVKRLVLEQATNTPRVSRCVRFDSSGQRLVESAHGSQRAHVWDLADPTRTASTGYGFLASEITALAWSPQNQQIAVAGPAGLKLWDLQYGRGRPLAQPQAEAELDLAFNPEGTLLAAVDDNRTLRLWCPATARNVTESLPAAASGRVYFSKDGRRLGLAGLRTGVRVWQVQSEGEYRVFRAAAEIFAPFSSLDFDPEGRMLVGASDLGAFIWDTATGRALPSLPMHSIRSLRLHPVSGDLFASGPRGMIHRKRRVATSPGSIHYHFGEPRFMELPGGLEQCSIGEDGNQGVVVHGDHMHSFQTDDRTAVALIPGRGDWKAIALSSDGKWVAAWSGTQNEIQVRNIRNPDPADRPAKVIAAGRHFAFSPDSRFLLTGLGPSNQVWSTETWTAGSVGGLALSREANAPVAFGRLMSDGRTLFAITDETGLIRLYELTGTTGSNAVPDFRLVARLEDPDRKRVVALAFNAQGSRLAAATAAQTVQVWDLARVQRGLARMGLIEVLPQFSGEADTALTVTFDTTPPRDSPANYWLQVEELTFALSETKSADRTDRVRQLVDRGTLYLDRLSHPAMARADFDEALRLNPGDPQITDLRNRADKHLRTQTPSDP